MGDQDAHNLLYTHMYLRLAPCIPPPVSFFGVLLQLTQETTRPPVVDSADVKKMLSCPPEEMYMFSDPQRYRARSRYTRFALPFREIEEIIQVYMRYLPPRPRLTPGGLSFNVVFERCVHQPLFGKRGSSWHMTQFVFSVHILHGSRTSERTPEPYCHLPHACI